MQKRVGVEVSEASIQIAHLSCNRQKGHQVDPMDLLRYLEGRYLNL